MTVLLFLDIDGVLHGDATPPLACLPLLESYLHRMPALDVIISSTWREDQSMPELQALFAASLRRRIVGVTPVHEDGLDTGGRQREIEAYLTQLSPAADPVHWIALDDWPQLFATDCKWLLATHPLHGFTDYEGCRLLDWYMQSTA